MTPGDDYDARVFFNSLKVKWPFSVHLHLSPEPQQPKIMRPSLRALALFVFILAALIANRPLARASPPPGYTLVWSDAFTGSALDTNYWNILTGVYHDGTRTPNAIAVANGNLTITTYTVS